MDYNLSENSYLAPYAISDENTWFSYSEANSDGFDHFKVLAANTFGFEDQPMNKGKGDYRDAIIQFSSNNIL